jgi:hypothetical protein
MQDNANVEQYIIQSLDKKRLDLENKVQEGITAVILAGWHALLLKIPLTQIQMPEHIQKKSIDII